MGKRPEDLERGSPVQGTPLRIASSQPMSEVYRFRIDLSKLDELGAAPPVEPVDDGYVPSDSLSELEGSDARDLARAAALDRLAPAVRLTGAFPGRLAAPECLEAYNASLERARSSQLGRYTVGKIEHHVFFDRWGNKHVVTRPKHRLHQRVSELVLAVDGSVKRLGYERTSGALDDTDDLLLRGLCHLDEEPERFVQNPGYQLRMTDYHREGEDLVEVTQVVYQFNPESLEIDRFEH